MRIYRKSSEVFCFIFPWLGLSDLFFTLYLNSVCHGPRTELQPRWLCHSPRITFYPCIFTLLSSFLPCPSPSVLAETLWPEFCMFQLSRMLSTKVKASSPGLIPCGCDPSICLYAPLPPVVHSVLDASFCEHAASLALHSMWMGRRGGRRIGASRPLSPQHAFAAHLSQLCSSQPSLRVNIALFSPSQSMAGLDKPL